MDVVRNCGKKVGGQCWEWDICPHQAEEAFDLIDYDDGLTFEEQAEEDSWLQWYGGWGSFGMGIDALQDELDFPDWNGPETDSGRRESATEGVVGECDECDGGSAICENTTTELDANGSDCDGYIGAEAWCGCHDGGPFTAAE